jgi:hypothetical protein
MILVGALFTVHVWLGTAVKQPSGRKLLSTFHSVTFLLLHCTQDKPATAARQLKLCGAQKISAAGEQSPPPFRPLKYIRIFGG